MERCKKSEVGKRGESLACELLESRGWRVIERNWRAGHYEIDIIAIFNSAIHFVEVRSLTYPNMVEPFETIGFYKQSRLIKAANRYVAKNRVKLEVIFDVVSVVFNGDNYKVEVIESAFSPIWG